MLTKKYFREVAERLSELPEEAQEEAVKLQISVLRGTNPRFDSDRFKAYIKRKVMEKRFRQMGFADAKLVKKMVKKSFGYIPH
jgi:hypothetical protein